MWLFRSKTHSCSKNQKKKLTASVHFLVSLLFIQFAFPVSFPELGGALKIQNRFANVLSVTKDKKHRKNQDLGSEIPASEEDPSDPVKDDLVEHEHYCFIVFDMNEVTKPSVITVQQPPNLSTVEKLSRRLSSFHSLNSPPILA